MADPEAALPDVVRLDPADGPVAPVPEASACVPSPAVQTARPSVAVHVSPIATSGRPAVVAAASTRALKPIAVRVRTGFQAAMLRTPP
ncbi:hypothetical protein [Actinomycetospora sp. NBRC 106378]|uniref:hypothetical protein n=1 Tax=Actinomycetospora sp. NBRC 106378 TaxID=3032208 RepID=UPI0024A21841|nr:hypothetical protein [Actinomycetospora sp. NBRC 106378]GLZ51381.1 hypothetical protein Acsp07_09980 [Actinomycetospora sp. NBRC 106378]